MHRKWILAAIFIFIFAFAWRVFAQSSDEGAPSLGDIAKKNKDNSKSKQNV